MKNLKAIEELGQIMEAGNYAFSTIKQYRHCLCNFSVHVDKDFSKVSQQEIQDFLVHRVVNEKRSFTDENQHINAIKLFWDKMMGKEIKPRFIARPKAQNFIPNILSEDQIEALIFRTQNIKHRAILFTIYHNALRISELLNIRLMNVRTKCDEPHIIIREAKNHHSRIVYMEERCLNLIRLHYNVEKPTGHLFEGMNGGGYSRASVHRILKAALAREGITVPFRLHDLRHCAATHALQNGSDIYHVSKWLGHKSVSTTEKYYAHLRPDQIKITRHKSTPKVDKRFSIAG